MEHDRGKSLFLYSDLVALFLAEDQSTIGVLAVSVSFLVSDENYFVLSQFSYDTGLGVSLAKAVDLRQLAIHTVLVFSSESVLVGDFPPHFFPEEVGDVTVGVQDLAVQVFKVADDDSFLHEDSVNFSSLGVSGIDSVFKLLNDVSVGHVADDETVFHGVCDAWPFSCGSELRILEQ